MRLWASQTTQTGHIGFELIVDTTFRAFVACEVAALSRDYPELYLGQGRRLATVTVAGITYKWEIVR